MPSNWEWWAGDIGEPVYDLAHGDTREAVIADALRSRGPDGQIQIIEAQVSTAKKYADNEWQPFVKTRNHEIVDLSTHVVERKANAD